MKLKRLPTLILQGFFALLPLIVTIYVGLFFFRIIEGIADNIIHIFPSELQNSFHFGLVVEIIVVFIFLIILVFFGFLVRTLLGKAIMKALKSLFSIVPGLNSVYNATEQVVSVLSSSKRSFFNHPVLVEYPSPGIWAVAFNTGKIDTKGALPDGQRYTIFIPTTPNPTSGFLAVLPENKIREFDVPVEEAIKLILTGGIVKSTDNEKDYSK